jgi:RNA polymerase sigma factor (sigma-70 family)
MIKRKDYMPMAWKIVKVYGFGYLDPDEIESAAGLAYVNAMRGFNKDIPKAWPTYLFRAIRNELIKESWRKRGYGMRQGFVKAKMEQTSIDQLTENSEMDDPGIEALAYEPDPSTPLDYEKVTQMLIQRLGERNAGIYIMRTANDFTMQEIADTVGVSRQRIQQILVEITPTVAALSEELRGEMQ